jgi:hypothetical protein
MKLDHVCRVGKGARALVVRGHASLIAPLPTLRFTSNGTRCSVWAAGVLAV